MAISHEEQYNKNLNSLSYSLNILLGDIDTLEQGAYLWNNNIQSVNIESDIEYPIIYGQIIYVDAENEFFNHIDANNSTLLQIDFQENTRAENPTSSVRGKNDIFSHKFIVDRVELIKRDVNDSTYSIEFTSADWSSFNNYLPYSSKGDKQHLSILKDLFSKAGLDMQVSTGAQSIDKSSTFITPVNYTMSDSLKYILSISASEDTFVYNFVYRLIDQKYKLFSPKQDLNIILKGGFEAANLVPNDNVLTLNSKYLTGVGSSSQRAIYDISEENINGSTHNIEMTKDLKFYHYDQTKRLWSTEIVNNKKIINSLPTESSNLNEKVVNTYKGITDPSNLKFIREIVPREPFIYDKSIRDIFTDSKVLMFKTNAWINRQAGDFVYISISKEDDMYDKIDGLWFILKIIKNISGDVFQDTIYACRIDRGKPIQSVINGRKKSKEKVL